MSASSSTQSERKAMALKRDLNDIKNSMSEIRWDFKLFVQFQLQSNQLIQFVVLRFSSSLASMTPTPTDDMSLSNSSISQLQKRLRSSLENIVDVPDDDEPLVTFPDESGGHDLELGLR